MLKKTDSITLIVSCCVLGILGLLIITFFGSIISGLGNSQHIQNIKNGVSNLPFRTWILMGILLNILIMATYMLMKLRIEKTKEGEQGIEGNVGERGIKGNDVYDCC